MPVPEILPEPETESASPFVDQASINLLLALLPFVALLGAVIWRRRKANKEDQSETIETPQSDAPSADDPPYEKPALSSIPTKPLADNVTKAEPAAGQPKVNSGGFVTTRLNPAPAEPPAPQRPKAPPIAAPQPILSTDGPVAVDLSAVKAEITLMNAVVAYRLLLRNQSDRAISNLSATLIIDQAQGRSSDHPAPSYHHDFGSIETGASVENSGELRLPLAFIEPLAMGQRQIFVPMVRLSLTAITADGQQHEQHHAFIVGQEQNPPTEKMAPLRLDQGPRSFAPVGARALAAT